MAKAPKVSAPPAPTPPPSDDVLPVTTGEALTPPNGIEGGTPVDGSVPQAQLQPAPDFVPPAPTPPHDLGEDAPLVPPTPQGDGRDAVEGGTVLKNGLPDHTDASSVIEAEGEPVQPEVGGKLITDADAGPDYGVTPQQVRDVTQPMPDHEGSDDWEDPDLETLKDKVFDTEGADEPDAPEPVEQKPDNEKTNAELGEEVGIAHAGSSEDKPNREQIKRFLAEDETLKGKLPNGNAVDDEFWTAYDQAFDREKLQLAADELSDEDRLRRVEKTLGLLSPRS